ncbi:hypothetical protein SAMN02927924_02685 [Sphingobium faniae]|nr:hypothetical protein SAMN02927924_02685 [Sphingobium faniae]
MEVTDDPGSEILNIPPAPPLRVLRDRIDRLNISADAKALLDDLLKVTVEVGGRVISAGRQIMGFIFDLARQFPNTAFGLIVATVVSSLIASIPLLGVVLGPLLSPMLLAFGLVSGAWKDLKDDGIRTRISRLEEHFTASTREK